MGIEECPSYTGISDITGKVVEIRHATDVDMFFYRGDDAKAQSRHNRSPLQPVCNSNRKQKPYWS